MQGLVQAPGGGVQANPYAESVSEENAYGANSDAAFANLMNVLGATNQQEQQSRLAQVGMDRTTALQDIATQRLGLGTGIDMARGQAKEAWQQRADERNYANQVQRQTWNREERMRNQDLRNQERLKNYETNTNWQTARMQPILDLIAQTAGTNVDLGGIGDLLERLGMGGRGGGGGKRRGPVQRRDQRQARRGGRKEAPSKAKGKG